MLTYNHYNDFILKLNDTLKELGVSFKINVNRDYYTQSEIIDLDLSNLKIIDNRTYLRSIVVISDSNQTINYENRLYHLSTEKYNSDNNNFLDKVIKKIVESISDKNASVYKIPNYGFFGRVFSEYNLSRSKYTCIGSKLGSYVADKYEKIANMLAVLYDAYTDDEVVRYGVIFNRVVVNDMKDMIKITTYPYDLADLDLLSCKDSDLNKVFVHNMGYSYGYFYIDKGEENMFARCDKSRYILTDLQTYFNKIKIIHTGNSNAIPNFITISQMWYMSLPKCDDCGDIDYSSLGIEMHGGNKKINTINTIKLCESCESFLKRYEIDLNNYQPHKHDVNTYSFKQTIKFSKYGSESVPLYLGVELEVDEGGGASSEDEHGNTDSGSIDEGEHDYNANLVLQTISKEGLVDAKTDGSLNSGFEMVSHPITLAKHLKTMQWKKGFDLLTKMGYASHNTTTCGLHVHINKDFFGKGTAININGGKIAYLLEKNKTDFIKFTRRREGALNRWADFRNLYTKLHNGFGGLTKTKSNLASLFRSEYPKRNKYIALNTMHENTFEFRIFRGTLNHDTFVATLQLVDNLSRLVKDIPNDDTMFTTLDTITFDDIVNYRPYNELSKYWESRKGLN